MSWKLPIAAISSPIFTSIVIFEVEFDE